MDEAAVALLARTFERVQRRNSERAAKPELAQAMTSLANWQVARMRATYADLAASPRYAPAMEFLATDLYGGDSARRDEDLVRAVPTMKRLLSDSALHTVSDAIEIHALSQELDRAMVEALSPIGPRYGVADYCAAYRRVGGYHRRARQVRLIGDVGVALDRYVRNPMLRAGLILARKPARMAGLSALQDFLERGFDAFARMRGAVEFLATIESRETTLHESIIAGANAPFPEPRTAMRDAAAAVKNK